MYMYTWGCLDKYIKIATWTPKQKFLTPPLKEMVMLTHS